MKNKALLGLSLVMGQNVIHGLYFVLISLAIKDMGSLAFLFWVSLIGLLTFCLINFPRKNFWKEIKIKSTWKYYFYIAWLVVIIPMSMVVIGAKYTSSINTSILILSELIYVYLFKRFFNEQHNIELTIGSFVVFIGAILVALNGTLILNWADLLILLAPLPIPFASMFAKKAMQKVSSYTVLFGRLVFAVPVLFLMVLIFEDAKFSIPNTQTLVYLIITGVVIQALSKVMWYESLKRMRIVTATAIGMTFPVFTMIFSYLLEKVSPSFWQIVGFSFCLFGVLIAYKGESKLNKKEQTATEFI